MALTLEAERELESVGLIAFFNKDRKPWKVLAQQSYTFVRKAFPEGATIRHDDVAKVLLPVLEVEAALTEFLNQKKLKQKYWRRHYCDLILDRCWSEVAA